MVKALYEKETIEQEDIEKILGKAPESKKQEKQEKQEEQAHPIT